MEKNLQSDQRVSGHSKRMGLSAKPEFYEKLRSLSFYERRLQIEILEETLELYLKSKKTKQQTTNIYRLLGANNSQEIQTLLANRTLPQVVLKLNNLTYKLNTYQQTIPAIERQIQPFLVNMSLMELAMRINNLNPEQFNRIGLTTTYQVLKETLSEWFNLEKEKRNIKQTLILPTNAPPSTPHHQSQNHSQKRQNGKTYFLILDEDTNQVYYAFPNFIKKGE